MNQPNKQVHIFGGGTVAHVFSHLAISAPAYGTTARKLAELVDQRFNSDQPTVRINCHLTRMAGGLNADLGNISYHCGQMETNEDVADKLNEIKADPNTMIVFMSAALVDFGPQDGPIFDGKPRKHAYRLDSTSGHLLDLHCKPLPKVISSIRENRKDIFVVGFKTTCGADRKTMFEKGLRLLKNSHVNLCLVNDTQTRLNMIVTPEESTYHVTTDRNDVLTQLVDIAWHRSHLKFTQSNVVAGNRVTWGDPRVPRALRAVVEHCIDRGAYKEFNGSTVGHFAVKLSDTEFLTSIRRSNFNDLEKVGLVYVKTDGPDTVTAYGAKPSVGGQSQRTVFRDHPGMDCIVHFHCPFRPYREGVSDPIPVRSQREVECGSHQCGQNTSDGLQQFGNLKAVMLENHGPNIVFNSSIDPLEVIHFIERNFDLTDKTSGYQ